jgi:arylsulfatase A-like enzyme
MNRLSPLAFLLFLVIAALPPQCFAAEKMNVMFFAVDDLRPELGCYGSQVKSPNLDALAKRGLLFNRAYCQQAVCSPSRTSLLTGRRPDTTKIYDLETHFRDTIPDVVTLPQYFMQNGYHAQSFGKVYHGSLNDPKSWSVPHTQNRQPHYSDPKTLEALKKASADTTEVGGKNKGPASEIAEVDSDSQLPDGFIADKAIEAMRQVKDKPFFLAVGFVKPHLPFVAPRRFFDLYPRESIELSPNRKPPQGVPPIALTNFAELRAYSDMPKTGPLSDDQARALRRAYYASISFMDAQVGKVIEELDRLGLREKTIIIVWGDHGWHLGDQGLWCKHTNFEIAARTVMMISVPGAKHAGAKTDALTELIDIYPTLCDLAGLPKPGGLEGTSFAPLLDDPARAWKSAAFSQYPRQKDVMGHSMRTSKYRYTEWQKGTAKEVVARELYDEEKDPLETVNLANEPQQGETIKTLSAQLNAGWKESAPK